MTESQPFRAVTVSYTHLGNQWGFIDNTGKEIIVPKYDDIGLVQFMNKPDFSEGMTKVKSGGKWGYVDKTDPVSYTHLARVIS